MTFEFNMISWIISSSALILVVIALRYLLRGKISLRLGYGLWLLVALRLLLPFSFGTSPLSMAGAAENIPAVQDYQSVSQVDSIRQAEGGAVWGEPAFELMPDAPLLVAEHKTEAEFARLERMINWRHVFNHRWLGVFLFALYLISVNQRFAARLVKTRRSFTCQLEPDSCHSERSEESFFKVKGKRRILRGFAPQNDKGEGNDKRALPVYVSEAVETPCLFGLFEPAIYLTPEAAADETTRSHAIAHELTHYRHGDHIWALLRCACLCLHWYNPLVWWAAALSRRDSELACDEGTIARLGEDQRQEYGHTLIDLTRAKPGPTALLRTATTMLGSKSGLKERVRLIAKKPRMAAYTLAALIIIATVAAACAFTGAEDKTGAEDQPLAAAPAAISIALATEEALAPYAAYDEVDASLDEYGQRLLLTAEGGVYLPSLFPLVWDEDEQALLPRGVPFYQAAELTPERPLVVWVSFPGVLPTVGLSYRDASGAERLYHIADSGEDGSPLLVEATPAQLDVAAAMKSVRGPDFVSADARGYVDMNITAFALAQALNDAADSQLINPGQEIVDDFLYDPYPHWSIGYTWRQGGPDDPDGPDRQFRLECGLMENIVRVSLLQGKQGANAYFEDETLYQLVRHYRDYGDIVDGAAYARFQFYLVSQMEETLARMAANPGDFTGYELTRFTQVWGYEDARDGAVVELYDFGFALLTDRHPREIGWAGGMYLDSNLRVQGVNSAGQMAARYRDGELVCAHFMGNDFSYRPQYGDDDEKWAIMRLNEALDWAEANSGRMSLVPGGLPMIVYSNGESITPLLTLVADKIWDGQGWLQGEGQGVANNFGAVEADLPQLGLADNFFFSFAGYADFGQLSIYDQDYQLQYQNAPLNQPTLLPPGTWYICLVVTVRGDYIEEAGDYETFSYECAFKLISP